MFAAARYYPLLTEARRTGPAPSPPATTAANRLPSTLRALDRHAVALAAHYGEQRLGLARTTAEDRALLARALRRLPAVRDAYEAGRIGFEASLLLRRILGAGPVAPYVERAWVARAEEATVKRLRDEARAVARRRAMEPGSAAAPLQDDEWYGSLRRVRGTAAERVARPGMAAAASLVPDVFLRLRLPGDLARGLLAGVESARRGLEESAEGEPFPWRAARPSLLAARAFSVVRRSVPAWVGLLALLEDFVAVWDDPRQAPGRRSTSGRDGAARRRDALPGGDWRTITSSTGRDAETTTSRTACASAGSTTVWASTATSRAARPSPRSA